LPGSMTEETIWPGRQPDSRTIRNFESGKRARALLIAGALVSWLVFALLSVWFLLGEHRVDRILLFGLEPPPSADSGGAGHFNGVAWSFTALGSPEIVAFFSAGLLGLLLLLNRLREAMFVLVSVGGGTVLGYLVKSAFGYVRPHHAPGSDVMLNTSFPSGHALLVTLLFVSGAILLRKEIRPRRLRLYVYVLAALAAALTGTSRVYLGCPSAGFLGQLAR
jgi:undecaprenyl-diphosphatase